MDSNRNESWEEDIDWYVYVEPAKPPKPPGGDGDPIHPANPPSPPHGDIDPPIQSPRPPEPPKT